MATRRGAPKLHERCQRAGPQSSMMPRLAATVTACVRSAIELGENRDAPSRLLRRGDWVRSQPGVRSRRRWVVYSLTGRLPQLRLTLFLHSHSSGQTTMSCNSSRVTAATAAIRAIARTTRVPALPVTQATAHTIQDPVVRIRFRHHRKRRPPLSPLRRAQRQTTCDRRPQPQTRNLSWSCAPKRAFMISAITRGRSTEPWGRSPWMPSSGFRW